MSLEDVMIEEVANAARYEAQLTNLERNLNARLKMAKEKIDMYNEKKALVQDHIRLAEREQTLDVPEILQATDKTTEVVHQVEWKLPTIRSQLMEVRNVYGLGKRRAHILQGEMEWKVKTDFERWRSTVLGKSPLSAQQVKREWVRLLKRLSWIFVGVFIFLYFGLATFSFTISSLLACIILIFLTYTGYVIL